MGMHDEIVIRVAARAEGWFALCEAATHLKTTDGNIYLDIEWLEDLAQEIGQDGYGSGLRSTTELLLDEDHAVFLCDALSWASELEAEQPESFEWGVFLVEMLEDFNLAYADAMDGHEVEMAEMQEEN